MKADQNEFVVVWNGSVRAIEPFQRPALTPGFATVLTGAPGHRCRFRVARIRKLCRGCGRGFMVRVSEAARRHCCSRACLSKPLYKVCPVCELPFFVKFRKRDQVHCSQRCAGGATAASRGASHMAAMGRLGGLKSVAMRRRRQAASA